MKPITETLRWQLSKKLLIVIIEDRVSDNFVEQLIWQRLGYCHEKMSMGKWSASENTPQEWQDTYPEAPPIISDRKASIQLTRSIPKQYKQLLKEKLNFSGYSINELYPRRTRRATAINWLLSWSAQRNEEIPEDGPLPDLLKPPLDPVKGHPGDPPVK